MTVTLNRPIAGSHHAVVALATVEAKRYLRRASIWIGFALTVLFSAVATQDWSAGNYESKIPLAFMPLAIGTLVAGVRTGGRDHTRDLPEFAEEAPLGEGDRAAGRLFGLVVPVTLSALVVIGIAIVSRIEGGFWLGDFPRRSDTVLHSFLELLQPPLLIALCGAAGVAAGRAARTTAVPAIIGGAVCFVLFSFYWVFSAPPGYALAPMQMQPMAIGLAPGTDPAKLPANWLADAPGEFSSVWHRRLVHQPTVAGHNIYLLGLIAICCGLAMRGRIGRRAALGGLAVAAVGAAAQLLVSPL